MGHRSRTIGIIASTLLIAVAMGPMAAGAAVTGLHTSAGPTRIAAPDEWASVSATGGSDSPGHTCGLQQDATLWCWGLNSNGELGLGDTTTRYRPYQVGSATWTQVAAFSSLTCAIRSDGTLWCWGSGFATTPEQVGTATTWTQIAVGGDYYCGIRSDTTLWCWGDNRLGELGLGDYNAHPNPTRVGTGWQSVTASGASTCAVKTDSELWCWGDDEDGQLGDNQAGYPFTDHPVHVLDGSTWLSVVEGFSYTCGVQTGGTLWCWGNNDTGNLGLGDYGGGTYRYVPNQVGTDSDWTTVTAGVYHTCGVRDGGELWCWGSNGYGELGLGQAGGHVDSPAQVGDQAVWDQPSSGGDDTCATQVGHTLWCWGLADDGELGIGDRKNDTTVPVQVGLPNGPVPVSHGLVSVSADSPTDIWAVGTEQRKQIVSTFVLHSDGSTWSRVDALNPSTGNSTFTAVDALAPDDVWAVGSYRAGSTTKPLTEHWDGSSWTTVDAPGGRYTSAQFTAIDALAPDDIWAVGRTFERFEYDDNFVEHWDGTAWTNYAIHDSWAGQQMTGVVALSPDNVWTVGYGLNDEEAGNLPVTYHWNGTSWIQVLPHHGDRFANYYLRGVAATPDGDLWAAGDWESSFAHESTRIEHHIDGSWQVAHAPSPGVGSGTYVRSVSVVGASDVWMVGDYDSGTSSRVLTLHWDGSAWTQVAAPSPGGKFDTTAASVSAVASNDVWAVGSWDNGVRTQPYVEHWDGSSWSVVLKGLPKQPPGQS